MGRDAKYDSGLAGSGVAGRTSQTGEGSCEVLMKTYRQLISFTMCSWSVYDNKLVLKTSYISWSIKNANGSYNDPDCIYSFSSQDRIAAFQMFAVMYIKYIQIFRKIEECYDQVCPMGLLNPNLTRTSILRCNPLSCHLNCIPGGGTLNIFGWGCAAQSWKPLPYFRPKYRIFHTLFQTWFSKCIPYFRPCDVWQIRQLSIDLRRTGLRDASNDVHVFFLRNQCPRKHTLL